MNGFDKLGLKKNVIEAISKLKIKEIFEVQKEIIPLALKGKNIVFTSKTGSGKTLAYILGFLGKLNKKMNTQLIVLVPTRELCIQVGKEIQNVSNHLGFNVGLFYGGRTVAGDYRTVTRKNHIIVGTPGRLILHVNEKHIKIGEVKYLIFDESDQMFDQGFYDDCAYIKKRASKDAQIILASATITNKVKQFMESEIKEYELLRIGDLVPKNIKQEKLYCEKNEKDEIIKKMVLKDKHKKIMIFCNTKQKTTNVEQILEENNINAKSFSSDLEQKERVNILNLFKNGKINVLVTTDVAARGLQIDKVDIVINYDVPRKSEFYIHRIGRSGRTNKKGYSLTLICPEDDDLFYNIEFEHNLKVNQIIN